MYNQKMLYRISEDLQKAVVNYDGNEEWPSLDAALIKVCCGLNNKSIKNVFTKIVAVDRLYSSNLIRFLPRPDKEESDTRPSLYHDLAKAFVGLSLDDHFDSIKKKSDRLTIKILPMIIAIHDELSRKATEIIKDAADIERSTDVFISKYLHFCRRNYFPVLDSNAEKNAIELMHIENNDEKLFNNRFDYDNAEGRYNKFCRAILSIQAGIAGAGFGIYSISEIDHYLYGDFKNPTKT